MNHTSPSILPGWIIPATVGNAVAAVVILLFALLGPRANTPAQAKQTIQPQTATQTAPSGSAVQGLPKQVGGC